MALLGILSYANITIYSKNFLKWPIRQISKGAKYIFFAPTLAIMALLAAHGAPLPPFWSPSLNPLLKENVVNILSGLKIWFLWMRNEQ